MKTIELYKLCSFKKEGKCRIKTSGKLYDEHAAVTKTGERFTMTDIKTGMLLVGLYKRQRDAIAEYESRKDTINKMRSTEYYKNCVEEFEKVPIKEA